MDIKFEGSVIFVRDITSSRQFYEDLLGQEVEMDFGPNVGFKGGFALWQVDHAFEMIYDSPPENQTHLGLKNFELYFETPNLENVSTHLAQAGVEFVHPLHEQPWGQRALRVYDPDGHIVELGEPMSAVILRMVKNGMPIEAIAKQTGMPVDIVRHITRNS